MKVTSDVRLFMKLLYYTTMIITLGLVLYLFWLAFLAVYNGIMSM
ncbi:hypothetical protein [Lacimicrobium sp. SS2-24]|nr:hypothetical protein [Lacimicrobium sp. SS2-24]